MSGAVETNGGKTPATSSEGGKVLSASNRLRGLIIALLVLMLITAGEYLYMWQVGFFRQIETEAEPELSQGHPDVYRPVADRYRGKVNPIQQEALALADLVIAKWPESVPALFIRGLILNKFLSRDLGVACLLECIRRAPHFAEPYYWVGLDRFKRGEYEKAINFLRQAVALNIPLADARVVLAEALGLLGRHNEAVLVLREQLEQMPDHPGTRFYLAHNLERVGQFTEAEHHYRQVIRLQPDNYQAWHGLAMLAQRLGRKAEAEEYFAICRKLQTTFHAGHQEARRRYDDHESLSTSLATAYTDVGKLFIEQGEPDEAAKMWLRAAEIDKEHRECRLFLADYYAFRREWAKAAQVLEELCQLEPNQVKHRVNTGAAWMAAGDYSKARAFFEAACDLAPNRADGYVGLVELTLVTGKDVNTAVDLAQRIVKLEPTADHYFLLARAYWAAGDPEQALQAAERAAVLDPGSRQYKEFLTRLKTVAAKHLGSEGGESSSPE